MKKREYFMEKKPARAIALLPIGVFLVLYLGLGCLFEYGLKIKMGFYNIPIVVAFLAAILVACCRTGRCRLTTSWRSWQRASAIRTL